MNYALEILKRHKETCEINLQGVPGMLVRETIKERFRHQLRDIKKAIEVLERTNRFAKEQGVLEILELKS